MSRFRVRSAAFAMCIVCVLLCLPSLAQERFGSITGVVTDATGAVVPEVSINIKNQDTNRTITISNRSNGAFDALDLEPGRYSVVFDKQGFGKYEISDVIVLVGKSTPINANLKVGADTQTVEVLASAAVIDTTSTMVAHNVTADELSRIPKGRSFEGVALLSPSVNTGFADGGYQINGASGAENAYYVDGVSTNSVIDGSQRQGGTFDYLQEVQVKTTGLDAEYGGALGGVVSAVTKSGGNQFHGDLHYYYYGNKLNTDPPKRLALGDEPAPGPYSMAYFNDTKNKRDNHEFGGSLGGPIVKDRLWFYTAASPRWLRQVNNYEFTDGPGTMGRSASQMNWFSKVSWNPVDRIRTSFSFLYTPQYLKGSLFAYNGFGPNVTKNDTVNAAAVSGLGSSQHENSVTGQVDFTLTNTSLLSVKGGRYYLDYKDTGVTATRQWTWGTTSEGLAGVPPELQQPESYTTPSAAQIAHDLTTRTYVQADFAQIANFLGQHSFKVGTGLTKNINNVLDSWAGPDGGITVYWNTPCQFCIGRGGSGGGAYGYYIVDDGGTIGSAGSSITHMYFQDSWRIHRRLTINGGVRLEREIIPSYRPDIQKNAIEFGFGDKIAPRIGASFDLLGNGKVKISAGWGRYYDWTKYDLPRGTFGADHWFTYYRSLDDPNVVPTISLGNMPGTNLIPQDHIDWRLPGFEFLDPNVKPMSSESMNAGVEWEIAPNWVFTGRYVRSDLTRTIEDMGVLINGSEQYFYGNPGEGQNKEAPSCYVNDVATCAIPMPKAKRTYDAMELSISRRFGGGYLFNASYVFSKLQGNYSGLQSTDEILPSTYGFSYAGNQSFFGQSYRPGGNANRYFDLDQTYYDAYGTPNILGPLPTDRPHVFKFYGAKEFKFGTEVGGFFQLSSGVPITTTLWTTRSVGMYPEGRGDLGREPVFNQTDLLLAHTVKMGETKRLRFEFNVTNLFNQKTNVWTYRFYNNRLHRSSTGLELDGVDLAQGFDWQGIMASQAAARGQATDLDPRFGRAAEFNPGLQGRLLIKYTF